MNSQPQPGNIVPHSYSAGYIVLGYLICLSGYWTALEIIRLRTYTCGKYNWSILAGAATSMGAVAMWCMHFISDHAIKILDGQPEHQILYKPGYTVTSFFLPVVVVAISLFYFDLSETAGVLSTVIGGIFTSVAICGMHYLGEQGVSNYIISYDPGHVGAAISLAVATNILGLGIFSYLRKSWNDTCLKRFGCAWFLASANTSMHWIAASGTVYRFKPNAAIIEGSLSREAAVIIVICLGSVCCIALVLVAWIGMRSKHRAANRACEVALACAYFDPDGRIMLSPDGLLPCQKITDCYIDQSHEGELSIGHSLFSWIFRASRCWGAVAAHIKNIRTHLRAVTSVKNRFPERLLRFRNLETSNIEDGTVNYPLRFKELFSYAADNLAQSIKQPLESIGVLFEGILETGTARKPARNIFSREPSAEQGDDNSESERHGQLLFVVRRLDRAVAARMQSKGYRFASFPHILNSLACSLKITTRELSECLDKLWQYSERDALLDQGVYLTSFILRPILNRQFDVLVRRDARNLLPTTQLPMLKLEEWQLDFLTRFNNCTVATVCNRLESESSDFNEGERDFASQLLEAIKELAEKVGDTYFQEARLNARPMQGPCIMPDKSLNLQSGIMIVFTIITDIHEASNPNEHYEFEPLSFFSCQQHAYQGSPDCDAFRHVVDRDFSMLGQHHGPDNGAIEMQQVRVGGETSTASADSVTFVDQLIGLINEERALRRRTEESMQAI